jgi:hypothetical protein
MNLRPYNGTLDRFQLLANLKSFLNKKIINFTEIINYKSYQKNHQ